MPQTQPAPQHEYDEELLTEYADLYQIMLYEQAEQCATLVHFSGKCPVKEGSYEDLLPRCSRLTQAGLTAEILPR